MPLAAKRQRNATTPGRPLAQLLRTRPDIAFELHHQAVCDALTDGDWALALDTAQRQLAPAAASEPLRARLESLMSLFAAGQPAVTPAGQRLLSPTSSAACADAVNGALLEAAGQSATPALRTLLQELVWSQRALQSGAAAQGLVLPTIQPEALGWGGLPEGSWAAADERTAEGALPPASPSSRTLSAPAPACAAAPALLSALRGSG